MHVLAISFGRNLFTASNPERKRMEECAKVTESLHMIVFARTAEKLVAVQDKNLFLHPTGGSTKIGMLFNGFILGRKILKQHGAKNFTITAQDPFEAGLVGFLLARLFSIPLNIQEHGDFFSTSHWRKETYLNTLRYYFGVFIVRQATTVRVVSKRIKNTMMKRGVQGKNIRELAVAVPVEKFLHAPPSSTARKLFNPEAVIVLSVARFVPQKNLTLLITAFAEAYKKEPKLRLLLIGKGGEQATLERQIATLFPLNNSNPVIKIIHWTDDVPSYMKSVDIYALSSNYEGYARVIPEAMASGLPIVTTDVGCVGEVCLHNEEALVVSVNDVIGFTNALVRLAQDKDMQRRFKDSGKNKMETLILESNNYPLRWLKAL